MHKGHHVAEIGGVCLHKGNANPDTEERGAVKDKGKKRVSQRHDGIDEHSGLGEIGVGLAEFAVLERFVVKGADDAQTGEILASKEGDFVGKFLPEIEFWHDDSDDNDDGNEHNADDKGDNPSHAGGGGEGLDNGADSH